MAPLSPLVWAVVAALPVSPVDLETVSARLWAGDAVTLARAQAQRQARGEPVDTGTWGLLDDLSRLGRCLPLGRVPSAEAPELRARRLLVRLERIRLERLIQEGAHPGTALANLLVPPPLATSVPEQPELVRWPVETERWPGEVSDPRPEASKCPARAGLEAGRAAPARARARAAAERAAVAELVPHLGLLPAQTACNLAFTYMVDAERAPEGFTVPQDILHPLEQALLRGEGPPRVAGLIALSTLFQRSGAEAEARRVLDGLLEAPGLTPEQDSRARVRLVALLEGVDPVDWAAVLRAAEGAANPRPGDQPVLENARARALFVTDQREALMTLGRRFVLRPHAGPFDAQTEELLLQLALRLPVREGLAWMEEVLPTDPRGRRAREAELGRRALGHGALELAEVLFDRLRLAARAERPTRGPRAVEDEAQFIAGRAEVAYERGDPEAFGGLVAELMALAKAEEDAPLARFSPHRAVAELTQSVLGRMVNRAPGDPRQAAMAGHLLEAVGALGQARTAWRATLAKLVPTLAEVAGPYAAGRRPPRPPGRAPPPVRQLGEVVVPRLPPRLAAEDVLTDAPEVSSFLVYPGPGGVWREGSPWPPKPRRR